MVAGSDAALSAAVEDFLRLQAAESSRSLGWHPEEALVSIVFKAWGEYIGGLKIPLVDNQLELMRSLNLTAGLKSRSVYASLDKALVIAFRSVQRTSEDWRTHVLAEQRAEGIEIVDSKLLAEMDWLEPVATLRASVDTMRNVMFFCGTLLSPSQLSLPVDEALISNRTSHRTHSRLERVPPGWFSPILHPDQLMLHFGEHCDIEEDEGLPTLCTFSLESGACGQLTEYEAYRRGDTKDIDVWQALRPLRQDRCSIHSAQTLPVPLWGISSRSEFEAYFDAMPRRNTYASRVGPFGTVPAEPYKRTCRLCARRTELWSWLRDKQPFRRSLSHNFCRHHRKQQKDGSWARHKKLELDASSYESRISKVPIYALEFARLHAHTAYSNSALRTSANLYADMFIRHVAETLNVTSDDHFELSRIAWQVVECAINDRKKEIIVRARGGESHAAIASQVGMARSNVSRLMKSIPHYFRLEGLSADRCSEMHRELVMGKTLGHKPDEFRLFCLAWTSRVDLGRQGEAVPTASSLLAPRRNPDSQMLGVLDTLIQS